MKGLGYTIQGLELRMCNYQPRFRALEVTHAGDGVWAL